MPSEKVVVSAEEIDRLVPETDASANGLSTSAFADSFMGEDRLLSLLVPCTTAAVHRGSGSEARVPDPVTPHPACHGVASFDAVDRQWLSCNGNYSPGGIACPHPCDCQYWLARS